MNDWLTMLTDASQMFLFLAFGAFCAVSGDQCWGQLDPPEDPRCQSRRWEHEKAEAI